MTSKTRLMYLELFRAGRGVGPLCPRGLPMAFGPESKTSKTVDQAKNYLVSTPANSAKLEPVVYPSMYWVMCPLARRRISMIEVTGGIARMQDLLEKNPDKMARLEQAHAAHRADFLARGGDPQVDAAVGGGNGQGLKCLHTHYAHFLATGDNVVGELVANELAALPECEMPCVTCTGASIQGNPEWHQPSSGSFGSQATTSPVNQKNILGS